VEIEGPGENTVREVAKELGFNFKEALLTI